MAPGHGPDPPTAESSVMEALAEPNNGAKAGAAERLAGFKQTLETLRAAGRNVPVVVYADARPKDSASKYEPPEA
jgi:hypothetical protein